MSWTEADDKEITECLDRLIAAQRELESQLYPIQVTINNTAKIQSRQVTSYNDKRERITTKVLPKDKWGAKMDIKYRLKIKDECISKTNELLGVEDG